MKKKLVVSGLCVLIVAVAVGLVQAQKSSTKKVVFAAAASADFKPSPSKGVYEAAIWGDMTKGSHATFTKFDPGYDAGTHTHTADVTIVVIKGAYLYKDDAGEKRVEPGDYLFVPGGHKHWSGGDKTEGAVFYEEGSGKFDLIPAK